MSKLYLMIGLPGSGKSFRSEQILKEDGNAIRLNKDLLRTMLHFDVFNGKKEELTSKAANELAKFFLSQNKNVIIDDTNLNPKVKEHWIQLARETNSKLEIVDLTNVSVDECIERDLYRDKKVGSHVIYRMALQYLDYMKDEKVIICDIDGTVADLSHRKHFIEQKPKDWNSFYDCVSDDEPRNEIIDQVIRLREQEDATVIFVSGRPERTRQDTLDWLNRSCYNSEDWLLDVDNVYKTILLMRQDHDKREDTIVKAEIYDRFLKQMNIIAVFDDRPSVIRMWRSLGLNVIDVGDGIEF